MILLIEDRLQRLRNFGLLDLENTSNIELITGSKYDSFIERLITLDVEFMKAFDCIISHRSALNLKQRDLIKRVCRNEGIALVFFSGGVSYSYFDDKDFPYLVINARDFYSDKLELFLEHEVKGEVNLSILEFGKHWKLNQFLNYRNDLLLKISEYDSIAIYDLELTSELEQLLVKEKGLLFLEGAKFDKLTEEQIGNLCAKVDELINELI